MAKWSLWQLYSNVYDGDSRRSNQAFSAWSLEASRPSKVYNLGPWISIRSLFHQRTLPLARNKVGIFYSLASSNRWTDEACQQRVRPVSPALYEQMARWLVWPFILGGVPVQQSCPLYYLTAFVLAQYQKTSSHRLWTLTEPFWSRDSQWIHGKNEDSDWRSEVCNLQSTKQHKKILWLTKNFSSSVQT